MAPGPGRKRKAEEGGGSGLTGPACPVRLDEVQVKAISEKIF